MYPIIVGGSLFSYRNGKLERFVSTGNVEKLKFVGCKFGNMITIDETGRLCFYDINQIKDPLEIGPTQTYDRKFIAASCGNFHTIAIDNNGKLWTIGSKMKTSGVNKFIAVDCARDHTIMIDDEGELWGFGSNEYGQLGLGNVKRESIPRKIFTKKIMVISCGGDNTMVIDDTGDLWACGSNEYGQLGLGDFKNRYSLTPVEGNKIKFVSCGSEHTAIINADNELFTCGDNKYGQLGYRFDGENRASMSKVCDFKIIFVSCGTFHTLFVNEDNELYLSGELFVYGNNEFDRLFFRKEEWDWLQYLESKREPINRESGRCYILMGTYGSDIILMNTSTKMNIKNIADGV
jgi:alpha-tubulin suppressor-like RCC1 family protein